VRLFHKPFDLEFLLIPAGEFLMGSDPAVDPLADISEQPQHRVYLPDFCISRYPITIGQVAAYAKANEPPPSREDEWRLKWQLEHGFPVRVPGYDQVGRNKAKLPAAYISWHGAVAFCEWLSRELGHLVRLPTESEWEKAARGVTGQIYPWGDDPPSTKRCNTNLRAARFFDDDLSWYDELLEGEKGEKRTPVNEHPKGASPYGVMDMVGNVWQCCLTKWRDTYETPPDEDLVGDARRVLRDGSGIEADRRRLRCAARISARPQAKDLGIGFRVVMPATES
jgi:formylglycine-generating enzyme required for sulfatase activity